MTHRLEILVLAVWLPTAILAIGLAFGWRANAHLPATWHRKLIGAAGLAMLIGYVAWECMDQARMFRYNIPTFYVYRLAADIGLRHGWDHLYDVSLYHNAMYFNPPPLAWLIAALSPLSLPAAYTAWFAFEVILVVSIALLVSPPRYGLLLLYVAVALSLVGQTVTLVETSLVVVAAVAIAWRLLVKRHDVAAGLVLAAIAVKPNLAILVPIALAFAGRQRAFLTWAAGTTVMLLVSIALLGSRGLQDYIVFLQIYSSMPGQHEFALETVFGTSPSTYLIHALAGGLALYAAFRSRNQPIGIAIAAGLIGSALVSPTFHAYDWVVPLLGMSVLWVSRPTPTTATFILATILLSGISTNRIVAHELAWIIVEAGCVAWIAWGMPELVAVPAAFRWQRARYTVPRTEP